MIPTLDHPQKYAAEHRREATINISASPNAAGSDDLPRSHPSFGVEALHAVAPLRPHQPSPPLAPLPSHHHSRHSVQFHYTTVNAMPSSPNPIVRGAGRMKEGKRIKPTARGAQGLRPTKQLFSKDDRLARDGAQMHTSSTTRSSMPSLPPPPAATAVIDRCMPTAKVR
jgi:hypothetical protein